MTTGGRQTKSNPREGRGWPGYVLGGRLRTSTLVLLVAFGLTWWLYETYEPAVEQPTQVPASEVVPPGFIPDPAYTWAPRTDVVRQTPTTTPTTTTPVTTTPSTPTSSGEPTPTPTSGETTTPVSPTPGAPAGPSPTPSTTPAAPPGPPPASASPGTTPSGAPPAAAPTPGTSVPPG